MGRKAKVAWVLALALLGVACGSSDDGASGGAAGAGGTSPVAQTGPGQPMTLEEFCTAKASLEVAWCDYLDTCCSAADQEDSLFLPPYCQFGPEDPNDCVETFSKLNSEGGIHFDGTWGESCLSAIAGTIPAPPAGCDGLHKGDYLRTGHGNPSELRISSCRKTLAGARAQGDACSYEVECPDGLRCAENPVGSDPEYTCQSLAPYGGSCISDADCALGDYCTGLDFRTCGPLGGTGASCIYVSDCLDGYTCAGGECEFIRGVGESCAGSMGLCDFGLVCDFTTERCTYPNSAGMACDYDFQCEGRCDTSVGQCVDVCGGAEY